MAEDQINEILKFDPGIKQANIADDIAKFDPMASQGATGAQQQSTPAPAEEDSTTWKEALVSGFQSIPSSALSYGTGIVSGVGKAVKAAIMPKEIATKIANLKYEDLENFSNAMIDSIKESYGSIAAFKQTIAKDPVRILSDLSTFLTGAGAAVRGAGAVGKISSIEKVGKITAMAGGAMEPLNLARGIAAIPLRLVPEKVPIEMFQSAVKFGTTLSAKERNAVTKTAFKNEIMPIARGMEKLRGMIDDFNVKVNKSINNSYYRGHPIAADSLFHDLEHIKNQFRLNSDVPLDWEAAFKERKEQWSELLRDRPARSLQEVQNIKTGIYRDLESFYEKHKATPAKVELRKAVARNARQQLEIFIPEIKQLNKSEGELIELWDAIESKANRIANRDLIGIGLPIKMGAGSGIGYMFAGPEGAAVGTALGFSLGVFDTPQVKAKVAIVLNRLRAKGITVRPTTAALRLGLYQTGRGD